MKLKTIQTNQNWTHHLFILAHVTQYLQQVITIEPSGSHYVVTYFQYPGEYSILDYLFIYLISHQHQYCAGAGAILMLVSDTDSNSAFGNRLFWSFSTWRLHNGCVHMLVE